MWPLTAERLVGSLAVQAAGVLAEHQHLALHGDVFLPLSPIHPPAQQPHEHTPGDDAVHGAEYGQPAALSVTPAERRGETLAGCYAVADAAVQSHRANAAGSGSRPMTGNAKLLERITARPDVFGGKPIVRDMRISVELVLSLLSQGATQEAVLDDYPELEPEDIRACIAYAHTVIAGDTLAPVTVFAS